jgi:hypothetical protein
MLRLRVVLLTLAALVAVVSTTGTAEPSKYSYALVRGSCAPWDGGAVDVTLSTEPLECKQEPHGEYLAIYIWRGLPLHPGQVIKIRAGSDDGGVSRCKKTGNCERAESGEISFDSFVEGKSASGRFAVHFKNGETVTGTFQARWCVERVTCG